MKYKLCLNWLQLIYRGYGLTLHKRKDSCFCPLNGVIFYFKAEGCPSVSPLAHFTAKRMFKINLILVNFVNLVVGAVTLRK